MQHQDLLELELPQGYRSHHVNLRVVDSEKHILSSHISGTYMRIVRCCDLLFSVVLFTLFIITIPFVWIANLVWSRGPLFYTQTRVGKQGRTFTIYKFRSMCVNAEADGHARFTMENDERITAVGSFLRKTRIDELPQVINLIKGDMTLIGPRPERPEFVQEFIRRDPRYSLRSLVKPGITGWGQVKYKYTSTLEDGLKKLEYDLHFIRNRNLRMDLEIILRTVLIVISRSGT